MPKARLMVRLLWPELIKTIRITSWEVSPYFFARKHTRQPSGHADSHVSDNGEGSNLFSLRIESRPTFIEQTARRARYPGFLVDGDHLRRSRLSRHPPAHLPCRCGGMMSSREGRGEAAPWHPHRRSQLLWIVQLHSGDRATKLITTAFVLRTSGQSIRRFLDPWKRARLKRQKTKVPVQTVVVEPATECQW